MRIQAIRGNVPPQPLRWTLTAASKEFSITEHGLGTKLSQAKEHPGQDGCYTTGQLMKALWGDLSAERFNKLKAETAKVELETAILRGDYLNRVELENGFNQIGEAILQIIKSSNLDAESQKDLRRAIASIPVVIKNTAKVQTGRNGELKRKPGRPRKDEPAQTQG